MTPRTALKDQKHAEYVVLLSYVDSQAAVKLLSVFEGRVSE